MNVKTSNLIKQLNMELAKDLCVRVYTECSKLTSFFEYEMPYEKGS
jgi:hypothetical protein